METGSVVQLPAIITQPPTKCTRLLGFQNKDVHSLVFAQGCGLVAVAGDDGVIRVYDLTAEDKPVTTFNEHSGWVEGLAQVHGDILASAGKDGQLFTWHAKTAERVGTLRIEGEDLTALTKLSTSRLLVGTENGALMLLSHENGTNLKVEKTIKRAHDGWITGIQVGGGSVATSSYDGKVRLWDPDTLYAVATLSHRAEVHSVALNEKLIVAVCTQGLIVVYNNDKKYTTHSALQTSDNWLDSMTLLNNDTVAFVGNNGGLNFLSLSTRKYLARIKLPELLSALALSGKQIVVGGRGGFVALVNAPNLPSVINALEHYENSRSAIAAKCTKSIDSQRQNSKESKYAQINGPETRRDPSSTSFTSKAQIESPEKRVEVPPHKKRHLAAMTNRIDELNTCDDRDVSDEKSTILLPKKPRLSTYALESSPVTGTTSWQSDVFKKSAIPSNRLVQPDALKVSPPHPHPHGKVVVPQKKSQLTRMFFQKGIETETIGGEATAVTSTTRSVPENERRMTEANVSSNLSKENSEVVGLLQTKTSMTSTDEEVILVHGTGNHIKQTAAEGQPVKRKRGRPRKFPRLDSTAPVSGTMAKTTIERQMVPTPNSAIGEAKKSIPSHLKKVGVQGSTGGSTRTIPVEVRQCAPLGNGTSASVTAEINFARVLTKSGLQSMERGNLDEAKRKFEQALEISKKHGKHLITSMDPVFILSNLGHVCVRQSDLMNAEFYWKWCIEVSERLPPATRDDRIVNIVRQNLFSLMNRKAKPSMAPATGAAIQVKLPVQRTPVKSAVRALSSNQPKNQEQQKVTEQVPLSKGAPNHLQIAVNEIRTCKQHGCAKSALVGLDSGQMASVLAAFLINYQEQLVGRYVKLKEVFTQFFLNNCVFGSSFAYADEEDERQHLMSLTVSALAQSTEKDAIMCLKIRLKQFLRNLSQERPHLVRN